MGCRRDNIIKKHYPDGEKLIAIWMGDCVPCGYCKATHYGPTFVIEEYRNKTIFINEEETNNDEGLSKR